MRVVRTLVISQAVEASAINNKKFSATSDFSYLTSVDVIIICVPTPIKKNKEPDLSYILTTAETLVPYMKKGQLVVLGSTTYPGCTRLAKIILEKSKMRSGLDFHLAYAPERRILEMPNLIPHIFLR